MSNTNVSKSFEIKFELFTSFEERTPVEMNEVQSFLERSTAFLDGSSLESYVSEVSKLDSSETRELLEKLSSDDFSKSEADETILAYINEMEQSYGHWKMTQEDVDGMFKIPAKRLYFEAGEKCVEKLGEFFDEDNEVYAHGVWESSFRDIIMNIEELSEIFEDELEIETGNEWFGHSKFHKFVSNSNHWGMGINGPRLRFDEANPGDLRFAIVAYASEKASDEEAKLMNFLTPEQLAEQLAEQEEVAMIIRTQHPELLLSF